MAKKNSKNGGIIGGIVGGLIMIVVGTGLLWWNEGNNVRNIKTTNEVEANVVDIVSDSDPSEYEGKLVSVSGKITVVDEDMTDPDFGVSVHTAALKRVVEIYQWEEDSDTDDDGDTTYSYKKVWSDRLIDSSDFARSSGHENPASVLYQNAAAYAEQVTLGNYHLSDLQIQNMDTDAVLNPTSAGLTAPEGFVISGSYVTNAADLSKPQIGDLRITWQYNDWKEVSLIAQPVGTTFTSYVSQQGKRVNYITGGIHTTAEMITAMREQDKMMKWIFRGLGAFMIFIGYLSLITPLTKLASFIPLLGGVINGLLILVEFLIALVHSLLIIAVAWIRFRPVLGICLLAACAGLGFLATLLMKKRKAALAAA